MVVHYCGLSPRSYTVAECGDSAVVYCCGAAGQALARPATASAVVYYCGSATVRSSILPWARA
eukprot:2159052-Lingulodinium_polyedra.AAC.1